jgi:hypothetical protein
VKIRIVPGAGVELSRLKKWNIRGIKPGNLKKHALGKIILPSQASALRDREAGISAVNNINNDK